MKVVVKAKHLETEIIVEANPRLRDLESTTDKIVRVVITEGLALGIFTKKKKAIE